jgi:hypothetical protein
MPRPVGSSSLALQVPFPILPPAGLPVTKKRRYSKSTLAFRIPPGVPPAVSRNSMLEEVALRDGDGVRGVRLDVRSVRRPVHHQQRGIDAVLAEILQRSGPGRRKRVVLSDPAPPR